jgi:hypothetical protein
MDLKAGADGIAHRGIYGVDGHGAKHHWQALLRDNRPASR